jgi:hypothetical protein
LRNTIASVYLRDISVAGPLDSDLARLSGRSPSPKGLI